MIEKDFSNYPLQLDIFEGPLDLLLHLIRKHEIDIYDIPIVKVTRQYNRYLRRMKELDLEIATGYLILASKLVYIKSRIMLPEKDSEEEDKDPREELVERLEDYRKYKTAAGALEKRYEIRQSLWENPGEEKPETHDVPERIDADLLDLVEAFRNLVAEKEDTVEVSEEEYSIEDKMDEIMGYLSSQDSISFRKIFSGLNSKPEMITVFLAILELVKEGFIRAYQNNLFDNIRLHKKTEYEYEERQYSRDSGVNPRRAESSR